MTPRFACDGSIYCGRDEIAALTSLTSVGRLLGSKHAIRPGARLLQVLSLSLHSGSDAPRPADISIAQAVIAGWTGRDPAAVEKHIEELEALGVKRPATTPIFEALKTVRISAVPITSSRCSGASMPLMAAFTSSTARWAVRRAAAPAFDDDEHGVALGLGPDPQFQIMVAPRDHRRASDADAELARQPRHRGELRQREAIADCRPRLMLQVGEHRVRLDQPTGRIDPPGHVFAARRASHDVSSSREPRRDSRGAIANV